MEASFFYIGAALLLVVVFVFILKRMLRLALKLAVAGAVILGLLVVAGYGWWSGWFDTQFKSHRPAATRTAPSR